MYMVHYSSTLPVSNLVYTGDEYQDMNPKNAPSNSNYEMQLGSGFDNHHHALATVLKMPPHIHHFVSHAADVLADIIENHHTKDHHQLGHLVRDALMKRGVSVTKGGSFWSDIGKGISNAWDSTTKFVGNNAKALSKAALNVIEKTAPAISNMTGVPEGVIKTGAELGKDIVGSALPLHHIVGALRDVAKAGCPNSKANLIHNDCLMTNHGMEPSPVLTALHFASQASPHVAKGMVGGDFFGDIGNWFSNNAKAIAKGAVTAAGAVGSVLQPELAPVIAAGTAAANAAIGK